MIAAFSDVTVLKYASQVFFAPRRNEKDGQPIFRNLQAIKTTPFVNSLEDDKQAQLHINSASSG